MSATPSPLSAGKTILLTGASRGIGLAIATYLLRQNVSPSSEQRRYNLVLVARTATALRALEAEHPDRVAVVTGDFGAERGLGAAAVAEARKRFGRLDGLIFNHGTLEPVARIADGNGEEESWRQAYEVNVFSAVAIVRAALPLLREAAARGTGGTVLFTSSGAATTAYPTWGAYGSAKAALNHLTMTLANEERELVAIAIRPGTVDTEMQRDIREKHAQVMDEKDRIRFAGLKETGALLKPEQPGHVMARLVVADRKDVNGLSGRFMTWNADELKAWQAD